MAIASDIPKTKSDLSFKENKGQVGDQFSKPRPDVLFTGNVGNLTFHLRNNGISYQMYRVDSWKKLEGEDLIKNGRTKEVPDQQTIYRLDINWLNVNANASLMKENQIEGYDNYYSEVCPNGVTGVKSYKNISYQNLYNGIDLKWYEKNGELKYDYVVAAGSDFRQIKLEVNGAESISLGKNGSLVIKTPLGTIEEKAPYVTQNGNILKAKWKITSNVLSFDISGADPTKQLVIDPLVRLWGTYYGGNRDDRFSNSVVDANGNIYACGYANTQINIATVGSHQSVWGGGPSGTGPTACDDALLVKFDSQGSRIWATYYGGAGTENGQDCALDPSGNSVALSGNTTSTLTGVIATPGTHQTNYGGNTSGGSGDAFLVLFDNNGQRQWGTYYGGARNELSFGCDFDTGGDIYITGETSSTNSIASSGAHQTTYGGGVTDGYLAKFNNTGSLLWATYYGGTVMDRLSSTSSDQLGNVFVSGYTKSSNNISTPGAHQVSFSGPVGYGEAVIAKFNSSGAIQWGTYYGGKGDDQAFKCVCDKSGNIYISGTTGAASQTAMVTFGAHQSNYGGNSFDAFLLKMSSNGIRSWGTLYGGGGDETVSGCALDSRENIYLSGCTTSNNNISTSCAFQPNYAGSVDSYLAKFDVNGKRFWGTYYGGSRYDDYCSCSTDNSGNVYLAGWTDSDTELGTPGSFQPVYGDGTHGTHGDGFLVKFDQCIPIAPINTTNSLNLSICKGDSTTLTVKKMCGLNWFDVPVGGTVLGTDSLFVTPSVTTASTFYVSEGSCGTDSVRTAITVNVNSPTLSINVDPRVLCYKANVEALVTGAVSYTWYPDQWISCTNCSDPVLSPLQTMEYCVEGADANNCVGKACTTIEVNFTGDHNFSLPNAFTPNGDKVNDTFCLQGWDVCNAEFKIVIFDRWGERVFESTNPNFCWDGIYKGQLLSSDVYVYSVIAKYKDNTEVNKKGNITLIR